MADNIERPSTPPRQTLDTSHLQTTPEHVKQREINRLKGLNHIFLFQSLAHHFTLAKAAQRQKEQEASSSSYVNSNNKRSLTVTPAGQGSPTAAPLRPLKRDSRLGTYVEYDLSKMVNSKGGFLMDDGKKVDEDMLRKELEREKQRKQHNLDIRELSAFALSMYINVPFILLD